MSAKDYHWDNQEVKGGYDHDADRKRLKKIKEADYLPAGGDANLPTLGKCTACHRPAIHRWRDGTLICSKHWSRQLEARAKDMQDHPGEYGAGGRTVPKPRRTKTVSEPRRTKPGYGAKGDANWERRSAK